MFHSSTLTLSKFTFKTIKELKLGNVVGRGSFCTVREIRNIELQSSSSSDNDERKRSIITDKCKYGTSYVMKKINNHDNGKIDRSIKGLLLEIKFLSKLDHPNIMKLSGTSINNYNEGSFLIMERLGSSLEDKLEMWKNTESNIMVRIRHTLFDLKGKKKRNLMLQKYLVMYQLSSAMEYLHQNKIIHRDLVSYAQTIFSSLFYGFPNSFYFTKQKPDNIGFNMKGQLQLYDFGLAKELDPRDNLMDGKGIFKLTGGTGTMRYMAPEVVKHSPYGLSADVYSFGVILWQIMSCTVPYDDFSVDMYKRLIVYNGYRLDLDTSWPSSCSELISRCWSHSSYERPLFEEIKKLIRSELESLGWSDTKSRQKLAYSTNKYNSLRPKSGIAMIAGAA